MDLQVTVADVNGVISLSIPNSPKALTGVELLTQIVALKVLKTFDQDVFDPKEGTDFRRDIGQYNFSFDDIEEVRLNAISKISKIEEDILREQGTNIGNPSERLRSLKLLDAAVDADSGSLALRIEVANESGNTRDIVV